MAPILFVSTGFLVLSFLFFCVGAWRIYRGRSQLRPLMERTAVALIFATVGWQAVTWLRTDQPTASQARVIAVWVQLFTAFGISALMFAYGWLAHPPTHSRKARGNGMGLTPRRILLYIIIVLVLLALTLWLGIGSAPPLIAPGTSN